MSKLGVNADDPPYPRVNDRDLTGGTARFLGSIIALMVMTAVACRFITRHKIKVDATAPPPRPQTTTTATTQQQ